MAYWLTLPDGDRQRGARFATTLLIPLSPTILKPVWPPKA